ncbi:MAG: hypothetical protein IPH32_13130 [Bacteroidetes bacterium]|nr:hypothetical protein [Bacteroidota bacterium]
MEALNTIEKITLLVSTSIVCLANLFVLIERTKKSEKHAFHTIIQKLLGLKNTFFIFCLIVITSSCSSGKFLNRKYTMGRFTENVKSLKHNTIYVDTTKSYAYVSNRIELKKSSISLNNIPDKEIINQKVESIIKKDSIIIIRKPGRDKKTVIKNGLKNDTIYMNKNLQVIPKNKSSFKVKDPVVVKENELKIIKSMSKLCLWFSVIPFCGIIFSRITLKKIKNYKKKFPQENTKVYSRRVNLAIAISIITLLIGISLILYGVFYI